MAHVNKSHEIGYSSCSFCVTKARIRTENLRLDKLIARLHSYTAAMGSWDCYCAICGGPFCSSSVAAAPRSDRFLRRHGLGRYAPSNPMQRNPTQSRSFTQYDHRDIKAETDEYEVNDLANSQETTEDEMEDGSFDRDVISEEMTTWMRDLHVLSHKTDIQAGEEV